MDKGKKRMVKKGIWKRAAPGEKGTVFGKIRKAIKKRIYRRLFRHQTFQPEKSVFTEQDPDKDVFCKENSEKRDFLETDREFSEDKDIDFQSSDRNNPVNDNTVKRKSGRKQIRLRVGSTDKESRYVDTEKQIKKDFRRDPVSDQDIHKEKSQSENPINPKEENKEKHTAKQQKKYRLKREFDPVTGKETYRRYFDVRNVGKGVPVGDAKTVTAAGVDFMHRVNDEEDDNSATEAAGASIRTGSRFQDFLYESKSPKRRRRERRKIRKTVNYGKDSVEGENKSTEPFSSEKSDFRKSSNPFSKQESKETGQKDVRKAFRKRKIKRDYAKKLRKSRETAEKSARTLRETAKKTFAAAKRLTEIAATHAHVIVIAGAIGALIFILMTGISSCAAMFGGGIADVIAGSYQSLPAELDKADESMTLKEMELQEMVDRIETDYPGYDEYSYNLAAIGHNPFTLINFLSAKYVEFTAADVESEVQSLFDVMYDLDISEKEETRTRTVIKTRHKTDPDTGEELDETEEYEDEEEYQYYILEVILSAIPLETVINGELTGDVGELYQLYSETKGARQEFYTPLDLDWQSYIKSYYGYRKNPMTGARQFHRGVDISVPEGTNVYASQSGTVVTADFDDDYGIYIVIVDSNGYMTKYAHLESRYVSTGDKVRHGRLIGKTGSTGSITGSHLHIECLFNGEYYNPLFYFENGEGSLYDTDAPDIPAGSDVETLLNEAKKYLGYPYVWGGSNPTTSFDCSGFVCWVISNSGYADMPRTTAQGIYNRCTHISPGEARAGDLVFFTGTYKSGNPVSHVGIYCGDGVMIHAGDPIKYSRIDTSTYWQNHFYSYGRIPH